MHAQRVCRIEDAGTCTDAGRYHMYLVIAGPKKQNPGQRAKAKEPETALPKNERLFKRCSAMSLFGKSILRDSQADGVPAPELPTGVFLVHSILANFVQCPLILDWSRNRQYGVFLLFVQPMPRY